MCITPEVWKITVKSLYKSCSCLAGGGTANKDSFLAVYWRVSTPLVGNSKELMMGPFEKLR